VIARQRRSTNGADAAESFRSSLESQLDVVKGEILSLTRNLVGEVNAQTVGIHSAVAHLTNTVTEMLTAGQELDGHVVRMISDVRRDIAVHDSAIQTRLDAVQSVLDTVQEALELVRRSFDVDSIPRSITQLTARDAALVNFATSHEGFASQQAVWINQPYSLDTEPGAVTHTDSNERLLEIPFVLHAVLATDSRRVLDVGCRESLIPIHLASMGCDVTGLDPRPYGFAHPNLLFVQAGIEHFYTEIPFDAVIFLSTIEHIGVGSYGQASDGRGDMIAMASARRLLRPGGRIILTVPFGRVGVNEFERTYDVAGLTELLGSARLVDAVVGVRTSRSTWAVEADELVDANDGRDRVAMVVAEHES
jgi:SAM-dependent methyltransferase